MIGARSSMRSSMFSPPAVSGALPRDFPSRSSVQGYFYHCRDGGTRDWVNARLVGRARQSLNRNLPLSAASSTARAHRPRKAAVRMGRCRRIKDRKRHIVTDTEGFVIASLLHRTNIHDLPKALSRCLVSCAAASLGAPHLRRPHLQGPAIAGRHRALRPLDHRNAGRQRLPTPASQMGGRTDLRMAWLKPPPCQGLQGLHRKRNCLAAPREHWSPRSTWRSQPRRRRRAAACGNHPRCQRPDQVLSAGGCMSP